MCDTNKQQPILPVSFTYCGLTVEIAPPTPEETEWMKVVCDDAEYFIPTLGCWGLREVRFCPR